MDQVIKFYRYFGFPVILNQKSSSSKLPIIWSSISLMWFTYHYGHLWACHYLYRIYAFIAGFPDDGQPDYRDVQYLLGRVLHISTEFVWPLSLKVYLLASYFFRGDSSFYHVIKRLNAAFGSFKAPSTIFNYMVSFIFVLLLIVTSAQIYFALGYMRYCVESADLCDMPYIIPWIDPAGELLDTITTQMGNTFLPLLSSMACLQFALCVKSIVSQKTLIINQLLIDRLVSLFDAQVGFNRHLQGWLFVLFSLYALDLITTVSLVARQLTKAATYSIIFLSVEFSSIALVCYSSSRAVESVSRSSASYSP